MVVMSLAAVTPVFTIAKIDSLIHFQETSDMGDILVCRETWTPKIRMAYKLTTCTFQFVVPVVLVVSLNNCCTMTIQFDVDIVFVWSQLDGGKVEQKNNGISSRQNLMMP